MPTNSDAKCLGEIAFDAFTAAMGSSDFASWGDLPEKMQFAYVNLAAAVAHAGVLSFEKHPPAGLRKMAPEVLARWLPILAYAFEEAEQNKYPQEYGAVVGYIRKASAWAASIAAQTKRPGIPVDQPMPKKMKIHGTLIFPFAEMTEEQRLLVRTAESSLWEAGIEFGAGSTMDINMKDGSTYEADRQWDLDWELKGASLVGRPATDEA